MKRIQKTIVLLLVFAMLASCFAGCQSTAAETPEPQQPAAQPAAPAQSDAEPSTEAAGSTEKKTLKIYQFKPEISEQLQVMANEYMELHPELNVEVESVRSDTYDTLLKTKFASGEAPDIFNIEGYTSLGLWQEHLADLSSEPWVEHMAEITKEGITGEDGKIYGMGLYLEGFAFCYNTKMFEKAGISKVPTTLSEFEDACKKLEAAGMKAVCVSLDSYYNMGIFFTDVAVAHQENVGAFIEGITNGTETFAENKVFNEWADLMDIMFKYSYKDPLATSFSDQMADMANGEVAITLCNNGSWTSFQEINPATENSDFAYFPVPINDDAAYNDCVFAGPATYWVVNKNSESLEEAKEFLRWLTMEERGQEYVTEVFQLVPGLTNIPVDPEAIGPLGNHISNYVNQGKALGYEWMKYPSGMTVEFGTWIQKYCGGLVTREEMFQGFLDSWQSLL